MKAVLEFNLPEEQKYFQDTVDGPDFKHVIWKLDQYCINKIKYDNDMTNDEVIDTYEEIREKIRFFCDEMNLRFWE